MVNSKHLKRYATPRSWAISRKNVTWAVRSKPGPHPMKKSVPLMIALRDILHIGETANEVRKILARRMVTVDGKVRTDFKFPVGVMDIISLPALKAHYRVMVNPRGQMTLKKIQDKESKWKLSRVTGKTLVKGGRIQLNLHDGKNILTDDGDISTGDVLKVSLPDLKVMDRFPMSEESLAFLTGGAHIGTVCRIKKIKVNRNPDSNIVEFHEGFNTVVDHVFVVGTKTSEIETSEVAAL